jgi:hypothetical protein
MLQQSRRMSRLKTSARSKFNANMMASHPLQLQNYSNHRNEFITKEEQRHYSKLLQGLVKIDGYSVAVHQPGARRLPPDPEGDIPNGCPAPGTDACSTW